MTSDDANIALTDLSMKVVITISDDAGFRIRKVIHRSYRVTRYLAVSIMSLSHEVMNNCKHFVNR